MQPLSQVLQEYTTMTGPYAAIHARYTPEGETIQMLVRMGTATTDYPVTMRRDANALGELNIRRQCKLTTTRSVNYG